MDFLAPSYLSLLHVRQRLRSGESVRRAIEGAVQDLPGDFHEDLRSWLDTWEWGGSARSASRQGVGPLTELYLATLAKGLAGDPIGVFLDELESEMRLATEDALQRHLQMLPLKMLIPMLFFIFPGVMVVLIGPFLVDLLRSVSS